ncbi:hypothetical protein Vadar_030966 [Vaccinium darrowii]|uniref:Uncharacterized protein n=1 Tax=Vaccinium darrowii TaxID=229202 RepID=A0ACB7ZNQ7_9ERIC|nr:hypothetical protein Vadar_030966 [Vaccinium darrowii]
MEGKKYADLSQSKCTILDSNSITSTSLTLQSVRGIFAITGCVTILCLLVYLAKYIYENRDNLKIILDSNTTTWSRLSAICKHWDQRYLSSFAFSMEKLNDAGGKSQLGETPLRNSNSVGMASTPSEEEFYDATDEAVDPNSEGGYQECDVELIIGCGDGYCECDNQTCADNCKHTLEGNGTVFVMSAMCVPGTQNCICHIISYFDVPYENRCAVKSTAPAPAPAPALAPTPAPAPAPFLGR